MCGPSRAEGDGLRMFPGLLPDGVRHATLFRPDASLADADGEVRPEVVWAALDCPTSAPIADWDDQRPPSVLARLAVRIRRPLYAGREYVALSWPLGEDGRKRQAAAALYDEGGTPVAMSRALWIELKAVRSNLRRGVSANGTRTQYRTCPFCEATCGLELTIDGRDVIEVRGDEDDVFSHGFLCPKAFGLKQLHEDPDRVRTPLIRRDGELVEASWDEAFEEIDRRLSPLLERDRNSIAVYVGNPNAHNLSAITYGAAWLKALGSQNIYSASTVDQMPKQVAAGLMFGTILSVPVPDVDRTDHLLMLGANPLVSNGSLMTAPDMRGRLRRLRERGGKVVVVDPRRTRTAEVADEHHFIRPGTDAHLLLGIAHTLVEEGLADPGRLVEHCNGLDEVEALVREFSPEDMAPVCGIDAAEIRRMARELAAAERAACYARIGTCTQEFGTLASWLVDVVNVLTGNLDREGGAMFAAGRRRARPTRAASRERAAASASAASTAGCAGCRRPTASCRSSAWPRRSTPRARARSAR